MASQLDPPADLDPKSRAIWVSTLAHIMEAGTLSRLDVHSLAAYVQAVRNHQRASEALADGILIDGQSKAHPALAVQEQAARVIAAFARQFRLTAPASGHAEPPATDNPERADAPKRGRWCEQHNRNECTSHTRAGKDCHQLANPVTGRCSRLHDGRAKAVVLAEKLGLDVPTYGAPVKISAERALMEELWRTAGHVKWLGERVAELEAAALTWGTAQTVQRWHGEFPGSEEVAKAGPHVLLDLYFRERKHLVDVALGIAGAGLAARMVDAAQELGAAAAAVVDAVLHDLELSQAQWERVPVVVPRRFRELMPA